MQQDSQDLFLVNFNFNNEISDIKLNYYTCNIIISYCNYLSKKKAPVMQKLLSFS